MSFQAMAKAIELKIGTKQKFLLLVLANYADEGGRCWPSIETLCADTGMSRATVHRTLDKLIERGLVRRDMRFKGNVQISNIYSLHL